jgi:hypothetical protein
MSYPVQLLVYDLSKGYLKYVSCLTFGLWKPVIWHTSILVHGKELFYGGGIQCLEPDKVEKYFGMVPDKVVDLGTTDLMQEDLSYFICTLTPQFQLDDFTNEVSKRLVKKPIPQKYVEFSEKIARSNTKSFVVRFCFKLFERFC